MPLSYLRRPLFLFLLAYVALILLLHSLEMLHVPPPPLLERYHRLRDARVFGTVASPLKEDFRGRKFFLQADSLDSRPFRYKLLAYLPKGADWSILRPGMRVEARGCLRQGRIPRNPGEFDENGFLEDRGASGILRLESLKILRHPAWFWLPKAWAEGARQSLEGHFQRSLPADEANVFSGLCLGFKGPLRRDWNRTIQDAGATHLIVPSGAKTAFVMASVAFLATLAQTGKYCRFLLIFIIGGFYTLMVGAEAPYTRAFWGGTSLGICILTGRESGAFQATTLAALLTLLWDPNELFSPGFQMTYAAVLGLILAMPNIQKAVRPLPPWLARLAGLGVISLIVQLMLWPQFAVTFGRGSLIGLLANLVLVPASGLLMAAGFCSWLTGLPPLGPLARLFMSACRAFAAAPHAAMDLSPLSPAAVASYYLLAAALLVLPRWRASALAAAAGLLVWAGSAAAARLAAPPLDVLILRLPPAYPALLSFRDGRRWLACPGTKVSALLRALRERGVSRVDRLVLTGPWPERAERRLGQGLSWGERRRAPAPWRLCEGDVCLELGGAAGPRLIEGGRQNSIIPERLRCGAVEVSTDGRRAEVRSTCPPEPPSWSAPSPSSTTRPNPRPGA